MTAWSAPSAMGPVRGSAPRPVGEEHRQADFGPGGQRRCSAASWTCSAMPQDEAGPVRRQGPTCPIHRPAPAYDEQTGGQELLVTGIKVIDLLIPVRQGRQGGPVRGRRASARPSTCSNSSTTSPSSTRACRYSRASASAPVKANDFYHEMKESGVLDKVAMVYGQMKRAARAIVCVWALTGLTMAGVFSVTRSRPTAGAATC